MSAGGRQHDMVRGNEAAKQLPEGLREHAKAKDGCLVPPHYITPRSTEDLETPLAHVNKAGKNTSLLMHYAISLRA